MKWIMQPNQQDSNQSTGAPQAYDVPDYLHLDPTAAAQPSKGGKKLIIIIASLLIVITGAVGIWSWVSSQTTPEQRFYAALDGLMQAQYLERKITVKTDIPPATGTIDVKADFSNKDHPLSSVEYTMSQTGQAAEGQVIVANNSTSLTRIGYPFASVSNEKGLQINKWYDVPAQGNVDAPAHMQLFAALGIYNLASRMPAYLFTGNLIADTRQKLVTLVQSSGLYQIKSSHESAINNTQVVVYDLNIDMRQYGKIKNQIGDLLNDSEHTALIYNNQDESVSSQITIDKSTNRIIKVLETIKPKTGQSAVSSGIEFTYPSKLPIEVPTADLSLSS